MSNHKNVYIDCTDTIRSGINTGIQRTVRNIIKRTASINIDKFNFIPVIFINGRMYKYNYGSKNKPFITLLSTIFSLLRNFVDFIFRKPANQPDDTSIEENPDSNLSLHNKFILLCRKIMPFFFLIAYRMDGTLLDLKPIATDTTDVIFYADAFWNISDVYEAFNTYDQAIKIVLIYDVIPITNPECFDDLTVIMFKENLQKIIPQLQGIITISRSEMVSIATYLDTFPVKHNILLSYNHLGADFVHLQHSGSHVRDKFRHAMATGSTFLVVGTLEPRKNLNFVLDAFEKLWQCGVNSSLCIIGKIGWKHTIILERIKLHQNNNKPIFFFSDANDHELAFSYDKCNAVIFASIAEGFGLPLVEAMSYGKTVLASDISVFHEIGGEYPLYFSLDNSENLSNLVEKCIKGKVNERPAKQWLSWDDSVTNLFVEIGQIADKTKRGKCNCDGYN